MNVAVSLKPWRTLQAQAALAGKVAELIESDDGRPALIVRLPDPLSTDL